MSTIKYSRMLRTMTEAGQKTVLRLQLIEEKSCFAMGSAERVEGLCAPTTLQYHPEISTALV